MNIQRRLEALEGSCSLDEMHAIFVVFDDVAVHDIARVGDTELRRTEGESEQAFRARALGLAKTTRTSVPVVVLEAAEAVE